MHLHPDVARNEAEGLIEPARVAYGRVGCQLNNPAPACPRLFDRPLKRIGTDPSTASSRVYTHRFDLGALGSYVAQVWKG